MVPPVVCIKLISITFSTDLMKPYCFCGERLSILKNNYVFRTFGIFVLLLYAYKENEKLLFTYIAHLLTYIDSFMSAYIDIDASVYLYI